MGLFLELSEKCGDAARQMSYNRETAESVGKHLLLEAAWVLRHNDTRIHRKRDGLLVINGHGHARFMTWRERIAYWLLGNKSEIRP